MTTYAGDISGDLTIRKGDDVSRLTSVGGYLHISAEGAQFPVLTSVGGYLDIRAEGAQLPVLTSVNGHDLPDAETARQRLIEVAKHALVPGALDMGIWHNESGGAGWARPTARWAGGRA